MAQCTNGKEYLAEVYGKNRPEYTVIPVDKSTYPESEIRQKLAKNRNWQVCTSCLDKENKRFAYVCALNPNETVQRYITFDEACKDFHWKKFDIVNNDQSVKWYNDSAWDDEVEKIMKKSSKNYKITDVELEAKNTPKLKTTIRK